MLSNVRVPTTAQIRALEAAWIKSAGETGTNWGLVLMEIAGRGAAFAALSLWQEHPGHITVICGRGNNGGDGLVVARYLTLWGIPVSCFVLGTAGGADSGQAKIMSSSEAETNLKMLEKTGAQIFYVGGGPEIAGKAGGKGDRKGGDGKGGDGKGGNGTTDKAVSKSSSQSTSKTASAISNSSASSSASSKTTVLETESQIDFDLASIMAESTVIVDAIFGTGLSRPVSGLEKNVIDEINRSFKNVLAIDIPSGINSDSGQIMGSAVRANKTVTFGYLKPGHLQYPGAAQAGDLHIVDIGLPDFPLLEEEIDSADLFNPRIYLTTCGAVQSALPFRSTNSHKGTFGHLLTIGGSLGMTGAAVLCGFSALRTGAGLSYLAMARSLITSLPVEELVYKALPESSAQTIGKGAIKEITPLLDTISAVVLGPGLSQNSETVSFVHDVLALINKPCVIDADALNAISKNPACLSKPARNFVLTPHPKELSRLTGKSVGDLLADRIGQCYAAAKQFDCVVVLKGALSVIASPDGEIYINPTGNSGMATAGSGDVLSGIIGGLMAQGLDPLDAAVVGVYLHGKAGDMAADNIGPAGMVAGDITAAIPLALTAVGNGETSHLEELLSQPVSG